MVWQGHLFENYAWVERTLSSGSTVRLWLEPLEGERVKVLEFWRKLPCSEKFKRCHDEEGKTLAYASLGLSQSYDLTFL